MQLLFSSHIYYHLVLHVTCLNAVVFCNLIYLYTCVMSELQLLFI